MINRIPARWTVALLLLFTLSARADDFQIVPGQSIGQIKINMTQAEVHHKLGKPTRVRRLNDATILETWLSHKPTSPQVSETKSLKHHYLAIFYHERRVTQIEASSLNFVAPSGLTTHDEAAAWKKCFPPTHSFRHHWKAIDPGMASPAAKHLLLYEDAVQQGIAWKRGSWGGLAPEPGVQPEAVIVHRSKQNILLNPNDAEDYAGTVRHKN